MSDRKDVNSYWQKANGKKSPGRNEGAQSPFIVDIGPITGQNSRARLDSDSVEGEDATTKPDKLRETQYLQQNL